jgi:hypothetical protein
MTLAFSASRIGTPKRVTNLVTVGQVGSAGGASVVFLPSPNPLFTDIAKDGYILAEDIPAASAPSG